MGRIRKPPSSSSEPDPTLSEISWDCVSKHRSCWRHVAAYIYRHEKKITLTEMEGIKKRYSRTSPCFYRNFPRRERTKQVAGHDNTTCGKRKKLNTDNFENCMKSLWKSFPKDKKMSFDYLDSLWFSLYQKPSYRAKVLTWIIQKNIFSKKYVFVPIVGWSHWSLLILVHLGESLNSETKTPCMLLLDSLETAEPRKLEPEIRKFVMDIYKAEGRTEEEVSQIPLLVPKVPQQRNDVECGNYVLYFINLFIEAAPGNFSVSKGYPYFMKRNWFDPESLEYFYNKLEKELPKELPETNTSSVFLRKSQRRCAKVSQLSENLIDDDYPE